jgi:hypothetical protein
MALSNEEFKNCVSSYVMKLLSVSIKVHSLVYVWIKVMILQKLHKLLCVRYFDVDKNLIQLESILKFNCFLSMVYTKRSSQSYGGRNCGHRKNICENHWYRESAAVLVGPTWRVALPTFRPESSLAKDYPLLLWFVTDWLIDFDGVRLRLLTAATNGHIFHPPDELESDGSMILTGKPKNSEKTCPSATLSTTKLVLWK